MRLLLLLILPFFLTAKEIDFEVWKSQNHSLVLSCFQIVLEDFKMAHNPSLIEYKNGYLLTFRYSLEIDPFISYIGIVPLDESFHPLQEPKLLSTRFGISPIPSHSEDARLFSYRGRLFLIFNDNAEVVHPGYYDRRDLYLAELKMENGEFSLSLPLKLISNDHYNECLWQKNWVPFEWNRTLLLSYAIAPHEVIVPNLREGTCYLLHKTPCSISWDYGILRGGTPAQIVDGEYLAFFHSGIVASSKASYSQDLWHYFMGAYTFSLSPPFQITRMTSSPISHEAFYTSSDRAKRVIFPGGFVVKGSKIYLAYGKDDSEIWIAILDKETLQKALKAI
jgi:predicted GH43/DUF377 family glycosyl hydrolase